MNYDCQGYFDRIFEECIEYGNSTWMEVIVMLLYLDYYLYYIIKNVLCFFIIFIILCSLL